VSLRHELLLAWAALVVAQVLTLAAAVGLLARMTPAIGTIMEDNERSIAAVEIMLAELGRSQTDAGAQARFEEALAIARGNVTEDAEPLQLDRIEASYATAFTGDPTARERLIVALQALSAINREAMEASADRASGVGRTGAWAAAVLGLLSLLAAVGMKRRIERRVIAPIEHTAAAVESILEGDRHRRCPVHGPQEIAAVGRGVEALRERPTHAAAVRDERHDERRLLLALLDAEPGVAFLVDDRGVILHANLAGTNALLAEPPLGDVVRAPAGALPPGFSRQSLTEGAMLVRGPAGALQAAAGEPEPAAGTERGHERPPLG
jgi:nitrogen fixation/metabolism regulation signal transduction histidine kinase